MRMQDEKAVRSPGIGYVKKTSDSPGHARDASVGKYACIFFGNKGFNGILLGVLEIRREAAKEGKRNGELLI